NLVGCVNPDGSKQCNLPNITWRFVTAMAKGEPHHWASMGGNAQQGVLAVMFDGPRVNATYDPMRKQGAILLGNGGDNSNGSQGTFYEGAVTAAGTFPSDATDQQVQANVVAARYRELPLSLGTKTRAISMSPGSTREMTLTFTNTTDSPAEQVKLSFALPKGWTAAEKEKTFPETVAPGATVNANFKITSGSTPFNGDVVAEASWTNGGKAHSETLAQKVRNVSQVKINEFRISSGPPANPTDSFIELYNANESAVDISNWTLTEHPSQQAIFSTVKIPAGTTLSSHGFYLLGLSNSGLAAAAKPGDTTIYVRNTTGMEAGDTVTIGSGADAETHKVTTVGTAAANRTTVWQPLPDGPILTVPAGSANLPVTSVSGLEIGQKVALGYRAKYPTVPGETEQFEVVTLTQVGKAGTQAYLVADAAAGANNIKVTSVANISAGDKIRLDVDSLGHGIETVTVTRVGSPAKRTNVAAQAEKGATSIRVRDAHEFVAGDVITIGTPANKESVTVTSAKQTGSGPRGRGIIEFTPPLAGSHIADEGVVSPGTGLDLAAPLQFPHAANLPFSDRGTGISFKPATAFAHMSNEPVRALGTGIVLETALSKAHGVDAVVRDASVTNAGYQGGPEPNQWFGGPELTIASPLFGRMITLREGSMVLRDAGGIVVDSLNYGSLVDPWAAAGDQTASGMGKSGCFVPAPGPRGASGASAASAVNASAGRFPDGQDTGSNCTDFMSTPATFLAGASTRGASNIKVASVEGFAAGQTIRVDSGANLETAVIAQVGTPGAAQTAAALETGATVLQVSSTMGFNDGQTVTIGTGADAETATIAHTTSWAGTIALSVPLAHAHPFGTEVTGTGLTLASPLNRDHASESQVNGNPPTPGAPNQYSAAAQ
ncbi:MAG: lamin tail domain-containing protein, partial [Acidobacteriaceae bacterium]|nr:lamin tail domain-containing protein [Acidobacteriaceae bacterium]